MAGTRAGSHTRLGPVCAGHFTPPSGVECCWCGGIPVSSSQPRSPKTREGRHLPKFAQPGSGRGGLGSWAWGAPVSGCFSYATQAGGVAPLTPNLCSCGPCQEPQGAGEGWGAPKAARFATCWGAGVREALTLIGEQEPPHGTLLPASAAWPDKGLCLGWRGDGPLSRSSGLGQPGSFSALWALPPSPCHCFRWSHRQETWGTARLAADELCDREQVA